MRKLTWALIGVLIGQLLMAPVIYRMHTKPVVEVEIVSERDNWFTRTEPKDFVMHKVPSLFYRKKMDLKVHIRTNQEVIEAYKEISGEDEPRLMGFYSYPLHEIYCVNSVGILIHELRHVFEGSFHRDRPNVKQSCIIFK